MSALVLGALAIGTAVVGGLAVAGLWLAAALAVLWEWQHLIGVARAPARFAAGTAMLVATLALVLAFGWAWTPVPLAVGALACGLLGPAGLRPLAATGFVYAAALLLAVLVLSRSAEAGRDAVLWLFAVVWGTDVMAYFGGRLLGGPKLWPRLSPKKTWSGFLVGIVAGAALGLLLRPAGGAGVALFAVGLLAGAVAQGGDLYESALKRRFGAKDSGRLIPGHGGAMDRLDGFITAAVFAALLGVARAGLDSAGSGLLKW